MTDEASVPELLARIAALEERVAMLEARVTATEQRLTRLEEITLSIRQFGARIPHPELAAREKEQIEQALALLRWIREG